MMFYKHERQVTAIECQTNGEWMLKKQFISNMLRLSETW